MKARNARWALALAVLALLGGCTPSGSVSISSESASVDPALQKDSTIALTQGQLSSLKAAAASDPVLAAIYAYGAEPERIYPAYDPRPTMTAHGSVLFGKHCLAGMVWVKCRTVSVFEVPDIWRGIATVMNLEKDTRFDFGDQFVQATGGNSTGDQSENLDCLLVPGQVLTEQSIRALPTAVRATIPVTSVSVYPPTRVLVVSAGVQWECLHTGTAVILKGPSSSDRIN